MKAVYILAILVIAAAISGCVGNKQASTKTPATPVEASVTPATTSASPTPVEDEFGTESDLYEIDSLISESSMDLSLSESL